MGRTQHLFRRCRRLVQESAGRSADNALDAGETPGGKPLGQASAKTIELDVDAAEQAVGVRPETAIRLMQLAGDEDASPAQLQEVIDADPSMTMRTLKLANSAYYGMATRISRIDRAITMLGMATIAKLASSASMKSAFAGAKIAAPGITPDTPWRYSVSVAFATEVIVAECPVSSSVGSRKLSAEAFVTGLIHDIGTLVQAKLHTQPFAEAVTTSLKTGLPLVKMERRYVGIDHTEIGQKLATRWALPPTLINGIAFHHDPLSAEPDHRSLASVVHLAAHLTRRAGVRSFDGDTDTPFLEDAMRHLRIDPLRVDKLVTTIAGKLKSTAI